MSDTEAKTPAEFQVGDWVVYTWRPDAPKRVACVTPNGTLLLVDSIGLLLVKPNERSVLLKVPAPSA